MIGVPKDVRQGLGTRQRLRPPVLLNAIVLAFLAFPQRTDDESRDPKPAPSRLPSSNSLR